LDLNVDSPLRKTLEKQFINLKQRLIILKKKKLLRIIMLLLLTVNLKPSYLRAEVCFQRTEIEKIKNDFDLCKEDLQFHKDEFADLFKPEPYNIWKTDAMIAIYIVLGFVVGTKID